MTIQLTLTGIIIGAVIAQGVFAAIALLLNKQNRKSNRFLSLLLLAYALWFCDTFFRVTDIYLQAPSYYFLPIYYSLAFGPLLYFYTLSITHADFRFRPIQLLHFIPVLLQASLYVFLQTKDYEFRRWFWMEIHEPVTYNLEFNASLLSLLIYISLSYGAVNRYQNWIHNQYSEVSAINLRWLKAVLISLSVVAVFWMTDAILRQYWDYYAEQPFSAMAMGISILALGLGGLLQTDLTAHAQRKEKPSEKAEKDGESRLEKDVLLAIEKAMTVNQYYLDPNLSLQEFSQLLNLSSRQVSKHINRGLNMSFIDFVNSYRVEAVKQHLLDNDLPHLSLLGIALESGFNSKATFNRVFKKFTDSSPSAFMLKAQNT